MSKGKNSGVPSGYTLALRLIGSTAPAVNAVFDEIPAVVLIFEAEQYVSSLTFVLRSAEQMDRFIEILKAHKALAWPQETPSDAP